jgi:hypothetical protein
VALATVLIPVRVQHDAEVAVATNR